MIVLTNYPLPPSVNEYLVPVAGSWAVNKKGKTYRKGRWVKSAVHKQYEVQVKQWAVFNEQGLRPAIDALVKQKNESIKNGLRFALRVDSFFCIHEKRLWTVNNLAEQLDVDNRVKPLRDSLAKLIGIDDKYFFSGYMEKVSTSFKEQECAIITITRHRPRTHQELKVQLNLT